jgi:hypothetical protein
MIKIFILFSLIFVLRSGQVFSQEKNYVGAGLFNIGVGGVVAGVGAVINKKPNQKTGKQFLKGFGQGALGGYLLFESKRMIGRFAKTGNYTYVWPAKLVNSAGSSIIENAAANNGFLEKWHLNFGFARFEMRTKDSLKLQCKIMPIALGGVIYGFANGKLAINETLKTGSFVFTSNNLLQKQEALGLTAVNTILYQKNNQFYNVQLIIGHELIHTFQYEQSFGFNTYLDKPIRKLSKNNPWFEKFNKLVYADSNYLTYILFYNVNQNYDANLLEKEAFFYTE